MVFDQGARLGPYEVLGPIGAGGMGEVYRARDPRLGRDVAIKVLPSGAAVSPDQLRRFEDEARAAAALNHPNILSVLDVGSHDGSPYVVFELLAGETIGDRLRRGPLPPRKAVECAVQVCEGLAAAHAKGIVHRDLKPSNLFLSRDGHAKILDFGLAKLTLGLDGEEVASEGAARTKTEPGLLIGTLAYMSPEQVRGKPADARSDLFALGATLYEMLAGHPAFQRATAADTLGAILSHDPKGIGPLPSGPLPPALEPIVRRCLEKEPEERFQSARDLGFALSAVLISTPAEGTAVKPVDLKVTRRWLVLVGGLMIAAAGGLWTYFHADRPAGPTGPLTAVPFTTFPGEESAPTFSPDGSQIAFAWSPNETEGFDLFVKVIGSEKPLRLTTHPAGILSPAWSPDGRQIAFARQAHDGSGIYVVPALGGPERKLADAEFSYFLETIVSWSPDGKRLAFYDAERTGHAGVFLLDVATLERRWLGSPSRDCIQSWVPAFSPDGTSLAVGCMASIGENDVFVLPASGGTGRRVAHVQGEFAGVSWSADSQSLVFASDGDLWRVAVAGGRPEKILAGGDAALPAISRDGHRLAYARGIENYNIWQAPLAATTRSGGPPVKLVSSSRGQRNASFSPDGRRLAFDSNRSGHYEIWTSDADGSDASALTAFAGPITGSPKWSPDGRFIAFDSRAGGSSNIYVAPSEGGPLRRVTTGVNDCTLPEWSIDGRWLFFSGRGDGSDQIFKVPESGGQATQITRGGGSGPRASSDGTRIYYGGDGGIWSVSTEGGNERRLSGVPPFAPGFGAAWALNASGVYFMDPASSRPGINFFNFSSAQILRVLDLPGRPLPWSGMALSPDGRRLLYSQLDGIASDIMLVDSFR